LSLRRRRIGIPQQRDAVRARRAAPARPSTIFVIQPLMPAGIVGFGGALVSATSTSHWAGHKACADGPAGGEGVHSRSISATGFPPAASAGGGNVTVGIHDCAGAGSAAKAKTLFGGTGLEGRYSGERKRQRSNRYCQQYIFAHRYPLHVSYNAENRSMFAAFRMNSCELTSQQSCGNKGWR